MSAVTPRQGVEKLLGVGSTASVAVGSERERTCTVMVGEGVKWSVKFGSLAFP